MIAGHVFDERAHGVAVFVLFGNENLYLHEVGCDRLRDATMAEMDGVAIATALLAQDDRWLDDADCLDRRQQQGVGLRSGFRAARLVGILL